MKKIVALWIALLLVCLSTASFAAAAELRLITGAEGGTYYRFGLDLKRLVKAAGIDLSVRPSKGSVDNIFAVSQHRGVDLGIVQSDVLAFVRGLPSNAALAQIAGSVRMVFPLYDEDVHVVARQEIRTFEDLAGKRVAVGREGSGTYLTARLLFKLSDIRPSATVPIEGAEALSQLKAGKVDAMIYVAAAPVQLLKNAIRPGDGLALLPITSKTVLESYAAAEIPGGTYAWQPTAVSTVTVKAILVSFNFGGPECEVIGRFAEQIASGMEWLKKHGHQKWNAVELDRQVEGWDQYDCVRTALAKMPAEPASPSASAREREPVPDAVKGVLGKD